jgi:exodeoxyribonuclease VII large subunit
VRSAGAVQAGEALDIQFSDGHIGAQVPGDTAAEPAAAKPKSLKKPKRTTNPKPDPDGSQGSLL